MAPSFFARLLRTSENGEKTSSSAATSVSPRQLPSVEQTPTESSFLPLTKPGADEPQLLSGPLAKLPGSPGSTSTRSGRRSPSQDDLSTDPGDEDIARSVSVHSADFVGSDGESGEDTTTQSSNHSPRSSDSACGDYRVYTLQMLLLMRTAVSEASPLKYSTQPRPAEDSSASKAANSPVSSKGNGKGAFTSSKVIERAPLPALPAAAEDSWIAQQRKQKSACTAADDQQVLRAARSILNKLTIEKFDSLFEQLVTCGIKEPHHISMLMSEIFEKATTQHHFIPMYADCCARLEKDANIKAVMEEAGHLHSFRRLLLNQCQNVFEQLLEPQAEDKMGEMDDEMKLRRKQRALGNMKLIGQLLVKGMLSSDLFPGCSEALIRGRGYCPEALEALAALVMVAGPKFDNKDWQHYEKMLTIFETITDLTKDKSVPARNRFLLRDVLDARSNGWPHAVKTEPTTLKGVAEKRDEEAAKAKSPVESSYTSSPKVMLMKQITAQKLEASVPKNLAEAKAAAPWASKGKVKEAEVPALAVPEAKEEVKAPAFDLKVFRKSLAMIFNDLASDKNIPAAVQRVREQQVPLESQADQFVDIITRIVEERRGAVRRCELAFAAGLAAAECSAFDRQKCLEGIGLFFQDVYADLCEEVQRLPAIMKSEFLPTMYSVFPVEELNKRVPPSMRK